MFLDSPPPYTIPFSRSMQATRPPPTFTPRHIDFPRDRPANALRAFWFTIQALRFGIGNTIGMFHVADLLVGVRHMLGGGGGPDPPPHPVIDLVPRGTPITIPTEEAAWLLHLIDLLMGLRESTHAACLEHFRFKGIPDTDVLQYCRIAKFVSPVYYIIRDVPRKAVIVLIRGTGSLKDSLTCMAGQHVRGRVLKGDPRDGNVVWGYIHQGMHAAARHMLHDIKEVLREEVSSEGNEGLALHVVGHSLGGGTAVMLAAQMRELGAWDHRYWRFMDTQCVAFACPACMTRELAEACASFCTSVVQGADPIACFSLGSIGRLRAATTREMTTTPSTSTPTPVPRPRAGQEPGLEATTTAKNQHQQQRRCHDDQDQDQEHDDQHSHPRYGVTTSRTSTSSPHPQPHPIPEQATRPLPEPDLSHKSNSSVERSLLFRYVGRPLHLGVQSAGNAVRGVVGATVGAAGVAATATGSVVGSVFSSRNLTTAVAAEEGETSAPTRLGKEIVTDDDHHDENEIANKGFLVIPAPRRDDTAEERLTNRGSGAARTSEEVMVATTTALREVTPTASSPSMALRRRERRYQSLDISRITRQGGSTLDPFVVQEDGRARLYGTAEEEDKAEGRHESVGEETVVRREIMEGGQPNKKDVVDDHDHDHDKDHTSSSSPRHVHHHAKNKDHEDKDNPNYHGHHLPRPPSVRAHFSQQLIHLLEHEADRTVNDGMEWIHRLSCLRDICEDDQNEERPPPPRPNSNPYPNQDQSQDHRHAHHGTNDEDSWPSNLTSTRSATATVTATDSSSPVAVPPTSSSSNHLGMSWAPFDATRAKTPALDPAQWGDVAAESFQFEQMERLLRTAHEANRRRSGYGGGESNHHHHHGHGLSTSITASRQDRVRDGDREDKDKDKDYDEGKLSVDLPSRHGHSSSRFGPRSRGSHAANEGDPWGEWEEGGMLEELIGNMEAAGNEERDYEDGSGPGYPRAVLDTTTDEVGMGSRATVEGSGIRGRSSTSHLSRRASMSSRGYERDAFRGGGDGGEGEYGDEEGEMDAFRGYVSCSDDDGPTLTESESSFVHRERHHHHHHRHHQYHHPPVAEMKVEIVEKVETPVDMGREEGGEGVEGGEDEAPPSRTARMVRRPSQLLLDPGNAAGLLISTTHPLEPSGQDWDERPNGITTGSESSPVPVPVSLLSPIQVGKEGNPPSSVFLAPSTTTPTTPSGEGLVTYHHENQHHKGNFSGLSTAHEEVKPAETRGELPWPPDGVGADYPEAKGSVEERPHSADSGGVEYVFQFYPCGRVYHLIPTHVVKAYRDLERARRGLPTETTWEKTRYMSRRDRRRFIRRRNAERAKTRAKEARATKIIKDLEGLEDREKDLHPRGPAMHRFARPAQAKAGSDLVRVGSDDCLVARAHLDDELASFRGAIAAGGGGGNVRPDDDDDDDHRHHHLDTMTPQTLAHQSLHQHQPSHADPRMLLGEDSVLGLPVFQERRGAGMRRSESALTIEDLTRRWEAMGLPRGDPEEDKEGEESFVLERKVGEKSTTLVSRGVPTTTNYLEGMDQEQPTTHPEERDQDRPTPVETELEVEKSTKDMADEHMIALPRLPSRASTLSSSEAPSHYARQTRQESLFKSTVRRLLRGVGLTRIKSRGSSMGYHRHRLSYHHRRQPSLASTHSLSHSQSHSQSRSHGKHDPSPSPRPGSGVITHLTPAVRMGDEVGDDGHHFMTTAVTVTHTTSMSPDNVAPPSTTTPGSDPHRGKDEVWELDSDDSDPDDCLGELREWQLMRMPLSVYRDLRLFPTMMYEHYVASYADALISVAKQMGVEAAEEKVFFGGAMKQRMGVMSHTVAIKYRRRARELRERGRKEGGGEH